MEHQNPSWARQSLRGLRALDTSEWSPGERRVLDQMVKELAKELRAARRARARLPREIRRRRGDPQELQRLLEDPRLNQ